MSNIGFILCITPLRPSQLFLMRRASQSVQIVVAVYPHQILICKQGVRETLDTFLITLIYPSWLRSSRLDISLLNQPYLEWKYVGIRRAPRLIFLTLAIPLSLKQGA
ncbi:uncharacterized protein LACBIDRAFT_328856 [Laccaria bicolor S238N-H82]|uniref:Predicted protein n=1 Tax=Laccaria bicolor (strain S238N-H82 / ATCC MYA-4686) TaxID=486041 RepID=B0DG75_LACBS|nr:uncharacterized protein LACBIDRAFT_328856 [Laccaria bicolor S238N-H82]EDR06593.1 predicted protein [Laccaria bicolor S238N-H82]|eukprot:XP_001882965.1 predicted protein [Laccaria bicolor S238N-H82]